MSHAKIPLRLLKILFLYYINFYFRLAQLSFAQLVRIALLHLMLIKEPSMMMLVAHLHQDQIKDSKQIMFDSKLKYKR